MKKTLLFLSLLASVSSVYGDTGEGCSSYIDRVASKGGVDFNLENAAILTTDTAVKSAITVLGETTVSTVFPYASIVLRNITAGETTEAADKDLVACLESLDGKITELAEFALSGSPIVDLIATKGEIENEIIQQNNAFVHQDIYERYDTISEDLAGTLSYFIDGDRTPDADIYEIIKNDTLVYMIYAELLAFTHNLEFNGYCANQKNYKWTKDATDLIANNDSGNYALMDYYAQYEAKLAGFDDEDVQESDNEVQGCELGRDSYSRFRSLLSENASSSNIAQAFVDLGFTITLNSKNSNYLDVAINIENSKLADYRKNLFSSCNHSVKGTAEWKYDSEGTLIAFANKITSTISDDITDESFTVTSWAGNNRIEAAKRYNTQDCNAWKAAQNVKNDVEIKTLLNSIKVSLVNLSMLEFVRPVNELAERNTQFVTYNTGEIAHELLEDYMLIPQFTVNDDGDITGNYNHYQIYKSRSDSYLKHRTDVGIVTRNNGSGDDSVWELSQRWPGENMRMMNIYTDECIVISDAGDLHMRSCDDYPIAYVWDINTTNSGAKENAFLHLSSTKHKGQCLSVASTYPVIIGESCDAENKLQLFNLSDDGKISVNGSCLATNSTTIGSYVGGTTCDNTSFSFFDINIDGTIGKDDGSGLCLEAGDAADVVYITLQTCDSSNPAQKFIQNMPVEVE